MRHMEALVICFCLTAEGLTFPSVVRIYVIHVSANLHITKLGFFLPVVYSVIIRHVPTGDLKAEPYWPSHG